MRRLRVRKEQDPCELGIEAGFWQNDEDGKPASRPAILPVVRLG
jgi:hypothetical protein